MTNRSMYEELRQGLIEMKQERTMSAEEIVIDCKKDGTVQGMHFDELPLSFLGDMDVERASEIMHNKQTQLWDVVLPGQEIAHTACTGFSGYDVARGFEVRWLQACRKRGLDPASNDGAVVAIEVKQNA